MFSIFISKTGQRDFLAGGALLGIIASYVCSVYYSTWNKNLHHFKPLRTDTVVLYGGPQLSHQNQNAHSKLQIAHIKFKSLTANSNRSQQIQIAHSELQITHSKFKSPTANSNCSQQIKVAHSKFKSLTAIQIAHIKLQTVNSARRLRLIIHPAVQLV